MRADLFLGQVKIQNVALTSEAYGSSCALSLWTSSMPVINSKSSLVWFSTIDGAPVSSEDLDGWDKVVGVRKE